MLREIPLAIGKYSIEISGDFEAAHYLRNYHQPSNTDEALHGHSWQVFITLTNLNQKCNEQGLVVDFLALRSDFDALLLQLHQSCLNDHRDFVHINPTAENVASWFYNNLLPKAQQQGIVISKIVVSERPGNKAIFTPAHSN